MTISAKQLDVATRLAAESTVPLDRLPYTEDFERIYERFRDLTGAACSRHQCWWALLGARKRGLVGPSRRHPHGRTPS